MALSKNSSFLFPRKSGPSIICFIKCAHALALIIRQNRLSKYSHYPMRQVLPSFVSSLFTILSPCVYIVGTLPTYLCNSPI